jgi:hypothetical protein
MKVNFSELLESFLNYISNYKLMNRKRVNRFGLSKNDVKPFGRGSFYNINDLSNLN